MPTIGVAVSIPEPWATELQEYRTAIGDTTNLAARLQQLAEPGAILVSDTEDGTAEDDLKADITASGDRISAATRSPRDVAGGKSARNIASSAT